jgi:hypothetical protein
MGSIGASLYRHSISGLAAATHLSGTALDAARHAFIHGLDIASLVAVFIALAGAAIALRFLPAPARVHTPSSEPTIDLDEFEVPIPVLSVATEVDV